MITNTTLDKIVRNEYHKYSPEVVKISRELLCAREVIKFLEEYHENPTWEGKKTLNDSVTAYNAFCAPQEKTGEVK